MVFNISREDKAIAIAIYVAKYHTRLTAAVVQVFSEIPEIKLGGNCM